jgi:hypothetical protein
LINEEKLKYNEAVRALEGQKRELLAVIDNERMRTNAMIHDTKDSIVLVANDRIERAKDDLISKLRDLERVSPTPTPHFLVQILSFSQKTGQEI